MPLPREPLIGGSSHMCNAARATTSSPWAPHTPRSPAARSTPHARGHSWQQANDSSNSIADPSPLLYAIARRKPPARATACCDVALAPPIDGPAAQPTKRTRIAQPGSAAHGCGIAQIKQMRNRPHHQKGPAMRNPARNGQHASAIAPFQAAGPPPCGPSCAIRSPFTGKTPN